MTDDIIFQASVKRMPDGKLVASIDKRPADLVEFAKAATIAIDAWLQASYADRADYNRKLYVFRARGSNTVEATDSRFGRDRK